MCNIHGTDSYARKNTCYAKKLYHKTAFYASNYTKEREIFKKCIVCIWKKMSFSMYF